MAVSQGMDIDSVFRNEQGIYSQMMRMESAYHGYTVSKPATRLFLDVVALFKDNRPDFDALLIEAKAMVIDREKPSVDAKRPPRWSKYEAAILLEGYLESLEGKITRKDAVRRVSKDLRQMAVNQGFAIDDIFRNESGIYFQIGSMESAYQGHTIYQSASKLFSEVAELYKNNKPDFDVLLKEAQAMAMPNIPSVEDMSPRQPSWNKYEAAILLDGYLEVLDGKVSRTDAVRRVSKELRQMAVNHGIAIDDIFRNEKGIYSQMMRMESAYQGHTVNLCATGLFTDVADLYWKHRPDYDALLNEAKAMIEAAAPNNTDGNLSQNNEEKQPSEPDSLPCTEQDSRLLHKYPLIYKRVFTALQELTARNAEGVSAVSVYEHIDHIGRCADIEDILDNVSWSRDVGAGYRFYSKLEINDGGTGQEPGIDSGAESPDDLNTEQSEPEKRFYAFMRETLLLAETSSRSYVSAIRNCEKYAAEHRYASWRLYGADLNEARLTAYSLLSDKEFLEYNAQQHNRFKIALEKYTLFLGEGLSIVSPDGSSSDSVFQNDEYEAVLQSRFSNGFRLGSPIDLRKFRKFYSAIHGRELEDSDDVIEKTIRRMSIVDDNIAYLPQLMVSPEVKEKIIAFIEDNFSHGKTSVYYQAILTEFSSEFLDCHIYSTDMLRLYLTSVNKGRFYMNRSCITTDPVAIVNPADDVRKFLIDASRPVSYDEMYASLPHLPKEKIISIIRSDPEFIYNTDKCYFHQSCLHLSDEELEDIADLIAVLIGEHEFISGNELYKAVKAKYPYVIENNPEISVYGFRDALKFRLGNRFSFNGNIISRSGLALTMQDVFADFCKSHESFTLDELSVFADEIGTRVYFDVVYSNSLRVSQTQFVSKDKAAFQIEETDVVIDHLCPGDYIGVRKIDSDSFSMFPESGFPWNEYLLQHYVFDYSKKYKLIHNGLNASSCDGAIVKKNAGIETFDDLVILALANSDINLNKDSALQYLCDEGYLARRRYSSIEHALIKANALRNNNNKGA